MNEMLAKLEALLKSHDWYYEYSDDHYYWSRGWKQRQEISEVMKQLRVAGLDKEAKELYNKYAPELLKAK